ncbi:ALGX domain-containing protein [Rhodovastum atsumiense]|nr:hypothetical protein [Rhodovastum atsumiense]CAH2602377.1 ALGX domain-containing protein [Rhodovastum atsumiense]
MHRIGRRAAVLGTASALLASSPAFAQTGRPSALRGKDGWVYGIWDKAVPVDPRQANETRQVLTDTVSLLRQAGIATAFCLVPAKATVYPDFAPEELLAPARGPTRYAEGLQVLRGCGGIAADLAALFARLRREAPAEPLYFKTDSHWTAFAAEAAAAETAKLVAERLTLPKSTRPFTRLGVAVRQPYTRHDLVPLLPPAERSAVAAETQMIRPPLQGGGLIDDDKADVAVIGSSYMNTPYNFAPALSQALARPVSLMWKQLPNSVFDVMREYLEGPSFRKNRPALIVWNFVETNVFLGPNVALQPLRPDQFLARVRGALAA